MTTTGQTFGFDSTTEDVLRDLDLTGTVAVVTGATSGLGAETVRALASRGAEVVMTGRDLDKAREVTAGIAESTGRAAPHVEHLELGSLDSVRSCAERILDRHERIDVLVNNAGVMAAPYGTTEDGFELQFGVNHLGHFLLTNLLVPALLAAAPARVVVLSSDAHRMSPVHLDDLFFEERAYDPWLSYGQSKSANVLFAVELDRRLGDRGVHALALHPGVILTELGRHLGASDLEGLSDAFESGALRVKTVEQGAATSVYAATAPELEGRGGIFLEDVAVADVVADDADEPGVRRWAVDAEVARALWTRSEELVGQAFSHD